MHWQIFAILEIFTNFQEFRFAILYLLIFTESNTDAMKILKLGSTMVRMKYGISESTIQVEEYVTEMDDCTHCQDAK